MITPKGWEGYPESEFCRTVQCERCDQWMCACQLRAADCEAHFNVACEVEGEPG